MNMRETALRAAFATAKAEADKKHAGLIEKICKDAWAADSRMDYRAEGWSARIAFVKNALGDHPWRMILERGREVMALDRAIMNVLSEYGPKEKPVPITPVRPTSQINTTVPPPGGYGAPPVAPSPPKKRWYDIERMARQQAESESHRAATLRRTYLWTQTVEGRPLAKLTVYECRRIIDSSMGNAEADLFRAYYMNQLIAGLQGNRVVGDYYQDPVALLNIEAETRAQVRKVIESAKVLPRQEVA